MKGRRHHHHDGTQFGWQKEEAIAALLTQRNIDEAADDWCGPQHAA